MKKHGYRSIKNGANKTPTYNVWCHMNNRCSNPKHPFYHRYGGRGITVCERWKDFEKFFADMGDKPEDLTIERLDNSKGYEPSNCKWATATEQARNRVSTKLTLFLANKARRSYIESGETITAIANRLGVHRTTIGGVIRERVWLNNH